MVKKDGLEEPRKYFSTLHYDGQESRTELPTNEEQQELKLLKTDYEGKRYKVPADMQNVTDTRQKFFQIDNEYDAQVVKTDDIRWNREFTIEHNNDDYDYRYWLQYEVENMSSGNRSMRLLNRKGEEYQTAMIKLASLSIEVSMILHNMCKDAVNTERADNQNPIAHLIEINNKVRFDILTFYKVKEINFSFEQKYKLNKLDEHIEKNALFYHLARETLIVYFKSIRPSVKFRYMNKSTLINELAELDFYDVEGKTRDELEKTMKYLLKDSRDSILTNQYYNVKYVCEINSMFRKLYRRLGKIFAKWANYYSMAPGRGKNNAFFTAIALFSTNKKKETLLRENNTHNISKEYRNICVKLANSCLVSLNLSDMVNFDIAAVEELDSLYADDYEHEGTSYPNVIRMSKSLFNTLNQGNHPIIRHFQLDEKRNMYCLPRVHIPFDNTSKGEGGFLHNDCMTVSLHNSLLNLIDQKRLEYTRIELSQNSLDALNVLQRTQWSINLEFLHFIADFTYRKQILSPYPIDIRQSAWQQSDSVKLRQIFIDKMEFQAEDISTKSRFRTVNANLKQARKNLLNSCNVFWHPWFCDWRGRFNTRVNELSPQGDDLSKATLLFAEWKELGKNGKYWLYVRAYDLLHKIITPDEVKQPIFDDQERWVVKHLDEILAMGRKLNRGVSDSDLSPLLDKLEVTKPGRKSEIFQRIAFLIEFTRIHREYRSNNQDWSKVKSGLPIHLDASCNGFQHIAALTRNRDLAKSVNILNYPEMRKGDLYQEVADEALSGFQDDSEESAKLREIIDVICQTEESKQHLTAGIFTRGFCKPLVMITGYGAKDLASSIMNMNGKKNRRGRYKPIKDKRSQPTVHLESLLYEQVLSIHNEHGGLERIVLGQDKKGYLTPIENCDLIREFGIELSKYIRQCIEVVTDNEFGDVKVKLTNIYHEIDISIGTDITKLHTLKSGELRRILVELNLPRPARKADRIKKIRQYVAEKYKRLLYFTWQASNEGSIIRYLKWKLDHNRTQATLSMGILPASYQDPGEHGLERFLLSSPTLTSDMKKSLREQRAKVDLQNIAKKTNNNNSSTKRRLKNLVITCLRNIAIRSTDQKEKTTAKHHYYARFIELKGKRTADGKKNGHKFSLDTGNDMKLNVSSTKEFNKTIKKMRDLSGEIILGMVPNFIHSFDAVHLQKVILALEKSGINDFWAVHDSFGVHACHVEELRSTVKQTFVDLHKEPLEYHLKKIINLNSGILSAKFLTKHDEKTEPSNHAKDWINEVLEAEFLIS